MLLIFSWETKFCKFNELVPNFTTIVGITGVGAGDGLVEEDDEVDEEVVVLGELVDELACSVGLVLLLLLVGLEEELPWWVVPGFSVFFTGVGVKVDAGLLFEVVPALLTGVEDGLELPLGVDVWELLEAEAVGEEELTGLTACLLFIELLVGFAVEELGVAWLFLVGLVVLGEVDCSELEVWEELTELGEELVVALELFVVVAEGLALFTVLVLVEFDVVVLLLEVLWVVVLGVVAPVLEVLIASFALDVVLAVVSVVALVTLWLGSWLIAGADDPHDTTHAGITHATAAIPIKLPKIFQIFFFIQLNSFVFSIYFIMALQSNN